MKEDKFKKLVASIKEAGEIKTVREKLNVSQNEFALMIGVSVRTLQNWEQGRRKVEMLRIIFS